MNYHALRSVLRALCLIKKGGGGVGWGKPEERPPWWSADVPWTDSVTKKGVSVETMRRLVTICYEYYNAANEDASKEPSSNGDTSTASAASPPTPLVTSHPPARDSSLRNLRGASSRTPRDTSPDTPRDNEPSSNGDTSTVSAASPLTPLVTSHPPARDSSLRNQRGASI